MIEQSMVELAHGITLSCRSAGDPGRPVLMFLHGFPEAAFVWDPLLEHFSQPRNGAYRCIAPNLRGYEKSSAPAEPAAYRGKLLVQDIAALIGVAGGKLDCLIAHDWGGAPAWSLANQHPALLQRLAIINSPHAGTFQRELSSNPAQQAASAYMNFLIRPDAEKLLAEDDFRRLREFFFRLGAADGPHAWWTPKVEQQYREVWQAGLTGPLNYYRATPLRPPRPEDPRCGRRANAACVAHGRCADAGALGHGRHRTAAFSDRRAGRICEAAGVAPDRAGHALGRA